jgi:hypothetical protein
MKRRCNNKNYHEYYLYGGRGIKHCCEWSEFEPFYDWAIQNGYKDDLSIDRINQNGNYEALNCRWVSCKVQSNNRRSNKEVTYDGVTMNLKQWSEKLGVKYKALSRRLIEGWTVEDAFNRPLKTTL